MKISRVGRADAAFSAAPATTSNTIKSGNNAILKCNMIASPQPAALELLSGGCLYRLCGANSDFVTKILLLRRHYTEGRWVGFPASWKTRQYPGLKGSTPE